MIRIKDLLTLGLLLPAISVALPSYAQDDNDDDDAGSSRKNVAFDYLVTFFPGGDRTTQSGLLRIRNLSDVANSLQIIGFDDQGTESDEVEIELLGGQIVRLTTEDLELGNPDRGLVGAFGSGVGDWRIRIYTDLKLDINAYMTLSDGSLTPIHDFVEMNDEVAWVPFLPRQNGLAANSFLRMSNLSGVAVETTIEGVDDRGDQGEGEVTVTLDGGTSRWISVEELETGADLEGALGAGNGNWQLTITATDDIRVQAFVSGENGELTALSTLRRHWATPLDENQIGLSTVRRAWLPEADASPTGFLRLINRSDSLGEITIEARDESDSTYESKVINMKAHAALQLTSADLERGSLVFGSGLGDGEGLWTLDFSSESDLELMYFSATSDHSIAAMHDRVPMSNASNTHVVQFLALDETKASNQVRIINSSSEDAQIRITGTDEMGEFSQSISLTVPAARSQLLTEDELVDGSIEITGNLGTGSGTWQLEICSSASIQVIHLVSTDNRVLNVSTLMRAQTKPTTTQSTGDLNGDGKVDVVLRHIDGSWYYLPMDGSKTSIGATGKLRLERDLNWQLAGIEDFDGDGKDDILLRHTNGTWMGYLMDASTIRESGQVALTSEVAWTFQGIADFNADGRADVLLRHVDGNWRYLALNGLSVVDSGELVIQSDPHWQLVGLGDLSGDGSADILLRDNKGDWAYYEMDEEYYPQSEDIELDFFPTWRLVGSIDLNGDGTDDLLLRHLDGRWIFVQMDVGFVDVEQSLDYLTTNIKWQVIGLSDQDGDGVDDVLLRHEDGRWIYYRTEKGDEKFDGIPMTPDLTHNLAWSPFGPKPWDVEVADNNNASIERNK